MLGMLVGAVSTGATATVFARPVDEPSGAHHALINIDTTVSYAALTNMPALLPGDWDTLTGEEARKAFYQLFLGVSSHFDLLGDIRQIRALPLPFYTGSTLVEARGWDVWGRPLIINVVVRPNDVIAMDGTSIPIHGMNTVQAPILDSEEQAKAYLRFFTSGIQGKEGAFQIVEKPTEPWWRSDQSSCNQDATFAQDLKPLTVQRDGQGGWNATTTMIYSDVLFKAKIHVDPQGMMRMTDDQPVRADLPIRRISNTGIARQEYCPHRGCESEQPIEASPRTLPWATDQENLLRFHQSLEDGHHEKAAGHLAAQIRKGEEALGADYPGIYEKYIMLGRLYLAVRDYSSAKDAFTAGLASYDAGGLKDENVRTRIANGIEAARNMLKSETAPVDPANN